MTNQKKSSFAKRAAIALLGAATAAGTFIGNEGGFPPFYVNKVGNGGGVAVGLVTHVDKDAKFNGLMLSLYNQNDGTINGASLSIRNTGEGTTRGLEAGLSNYKWRGDVKGLQIGVINTANNNYSGPYTQLGIVNKSGDDTTVLVNAQLPRRD
jgi:hypothetical protein